MNVLFLWRFSRALDADAAPPETALASGVQHRAGHGDGLGGDQAEGDHTVPLSLGRRWSQPYATTTPIATGRLLGAVASAARFEAKRAKTPAADWLL